MGYAAKKQKPLTEAQLRILLETPFMEMRQVFPNNTRQFLESERKRGKAMFPAETRIEIDRARATERAKLREAERLYKTASAEADALRKRLDLFEGMPEVEPREVVIRSSSKSGAKREATAVVQASDWHMEEPTTLEATSGLNEYNLKIAKERSDFFFQNSAKLVRKEAQNVAIKNLLIWLGGDFFTGSIHPDCAENNALGPMDAIELVQDTLAGGLEYYLRELPGVTITAVCSVGNHSRTTKEQRIATEHENSLEWFAYHNLAKQFKGRIGFKMERSYLAYVTVHEQLYRFHHGHAIRGGDNIGGVAIPLMKRIYKWNQGRKAVHDFLGHFHTYQPSAAFTINGSLIGDTPYGINVGGHEKPVQAFTLIDSEHGITVRAPILLSEA